MNAAEAERIREQSASACRDNVGLVVAEARHSTAILSTCSERHVSAISDLNEPDRHIAGGSRWCGMRRAAFSARRKNKLHLRDAAFVGGPGDLAQRSRPFKDNTPYPMILPNRWKRTAMRYSRGRRNAADTKKKRSRPLSSSQRRGGTTRQ